MTDESNKHVLNTFTDKFPFHESTPFSINEAKHVTDSLISVTATIQDRKYHGNPSKPIIWSQRFMTAHNGDFVMSL